MEAIALVAMIPIKFSNCMEAIIIISYMLPFIYLFIIISKQKLNFKFIKQLMYNFIFKDELQFKFWHLYIKYTLYSYQLS
jgi:hypothetical protein